MGEARKHHFISRFLLRGFAVPEEDDGRLFVLDRTRNGVFQSSPAKSGHRRDYNRVAQETHPDPLAVERLSEFWRRLGADVELMAPAHHDRVLAVTSHLPHLIAYTIVGTATNLEESERAEVVKFSASGFRDFTRIAASNPIMWRDIFLNNRDAVLEMLQRFNEDITALQRAIRWGEGEVLETLFRRTREVRSGVIEAHQAGTFDTREREKFGPEEAAPETKFPREK